jgi:hypothetical protein
LKGGKAENTAEARFCDDILAFESLPCEIIIGHSVILFSGVNRKESVAPKVAKFISDIIEGGRRDTGRRYSFNDIIKTLKANKLEIVDARGHFFSHV